MKRYSKGQLKLLANFFSNLSTAWFTAGVISPFFLNKSINEKIIYTIIGLALSYLFINLGLNASKNIN